MEKIKRKNAELNERCYWRIFLPLAIILLLCLRFPIRITLPDLYDDILLYGSISLASYVTGMWIYRRSKWAYRRLLIVIFLCAVLAGWQVIDLGVMRSPRGSTLVFGSNGEVNYLGSAWYEPTFLNPEILCHSIMESYIGNDVVAIRYEVRNLSWWACGG